MLRTTAAVYKRKMPIVVSSLSPNPHSLIINVWAKFLSDGNFLICVVLVVRMIKVLKMN